MRLRNDREAMKVDLGVYFKLRPEMPEIVIEETYHVTGTTNQKFKMGTTEKNYLLSLFLQDIMEIYKDYLDKSKKKSKSKSK